MAYTKQLALSPLNVQTVSYDYEFEDAKVQKIWNTASKWKRNVEKNIVHTKQIPVERVITSFLRKKLKF